MTYSAGGPEFCRIRHSKGWVAFFVLQVMWILQVPAEPFQYIHRSLVSILSLPDPNAFPAPLGHRFQ